MKSQNCNKETFNKDFKATLQTTNKNLIEVYYCSKECATIHLGAVQHLMSMSTEERNKILSKGKMVTVEFYESAQRKE